MSVDTSTVAAESPSGNMVSNLTAPAVKTGRDLYDRVTGGVLWYIEQWEDLIVESKASLAPSEEGLSADSILASLSEAKVASDIPGRLRLRPTQLKGHDRLVEETAQALGSLRGVNQVEISSLTGSVLILYDAAQYASREALLGSFAKSE